MNRNRKRHGSTKGKRSSARQLNQKRIHGRKRKRRHGGKRKISHGRKRKRRHGGKRKRSHGRKRKKSHGGKRKIRHGKKMRRHGRKRKSKIKMESNSLMVLSCRRMSKRSTSPHIPAPVA